MKHPENHLLKNFALGNIDITLRILIESHLNFCSHCENAVREIRTQNMTNQDTVEFFEETLPESAVPQLFGKIMSKIKVD